VRANPENAYIVNGYTTTPSLYPQRHDYYTIAPTAADRKALSFNDYINEVYASRSDETPLTRTPATYNDLIFKKFTDRGYVVKRPQKNISPINGFKKFVMNPALEAVKNVVSANNGNISLNSAYIKQLTDHYFHNLITFPALETVYGAEIYNVQDKNDITKLARRPESKTAIKQFTIDLIQHRAEIGDQLIIAITDQLAHDGILPRDTTDLNYMASNALLEQFRLSPEMLTPDPIRQLKERLTGLPATQDLSRLIVQ
jgi:hypothetical protein